MAVKKAIAAKPDALLCLGSGDTPLGVFDILVKWHESGEIDFSKVHFVGLDEWLGMDEQDEGSCFYTMYQKLFIPLGLPATQIHCFDAKSTDADGECAKIDKLIAANAGLDFILLGIGSNGHLAMNEPGTLADALCHVSQLAESTILTGQKYFNKSTPLDKGITLGLKHIIEAKQIILMANGPQKAEIIKKTLDLESTSTIPSTFLKRAQNVSIMVDKAAAALLA